MPEKSWLLVACAAGLTLACGTANAEPTRPDEARRPVATARSFGFVALNVADMKRSLAFYRILGLVERFRSDTPQQLELGLGMPGGLTTPNLLLVLDRKRKTPHVIGNGFSRIAYMVQGLDELLRRFAAAGAKVKPPVANAQHHIRVAFVEDPDGYRVELIELVGVSATMPAP